MNYTIEKRTTRVNETRWRVKVRLKGARHLSGTFARKTDAKKWGETTAAAIRDGRHFPRAEAKRHTLSESITRYIEKILPRKPKTAPFQRPQLEFWRKELGHLMLADVSAANVVVARDSLIATTAAGGRKRGGATANRYLAVLSHLFTVAVHEWEWLDTNPVLKIRRLKEASGRRRFFTQRELGAYSPPAVPRAALPCIRSWSSPRRQGCDAARYLVFGDLRSIWWTVRSS